MTEEQRQIAQNIGKIRERIGAAAKSAGRSAENIQLIAVTKTASATDSRVVALAGLKDLGESRPQMLCEKASLLADTSIRWHLIGHLQRNKVAKTIEKTHLIHSVDSIRLLEAINLEARKAHKTVDILLEINISREPEKHGFAPGDVPATLEAISHLSHLQVRGLMAMASRDGGPTAARKDFAAVRVLRDKHSHNLPENVRLDELSIGMSADLEEAILEGATMVRVGRAIFQTTA